MSRGLECAAWGVVGRDPELKTSKSGTAYCSVSVAVTSGKDDAGKDLTQWCRVTVFKAAAEEAARTLAKGARCYFEGTGQVEQWQGNDGTTRTQLAVTAWKLMKVSSIGQSRSRDEGQPLGRPFKPPERSQHEAPFDDVVPF